MELLRDRLGDSMLHTTHPAISRDLSKLCEASGELLLCSRCSAMGPSLSHSPLLLKAADATHKLKVRESICIRTSSTIPGK